MIETDKELLMLAAKAAGIHDANWVAEKACIETLTLPGLRCFWNPLTYDGDALRLAVKLQMNIAREKDQETGFIDVVVISHFEIRNVEEPEGDDPYVTTRRAIVRAAAEIGKEK